MIPRVKFLQILDRDFEVKVLVKVKPPEWF